MIESDAYTLPQEVRDGIARARDRNRRRTGARLRVQVGDVWYPILAFDATGFDVGLDVAPRLRGHVEIHDGARMLLQALIVAGEASDRVMRYGFKRATAAQATAPLDYVRRVPDTAGLLAAD